MEFLSESIQENIIHSSTQRCASWVFGIFLLKQTFSHQDQISPVSHYTQCSGCWFPVGPQPIFSPSISVSPISFSPPALHLPFLDLLTLAVYKTAQCPRYIKKFSVLELHTRSHPRSNRHSHPILSLPKTHSNLGRHSSSHHVLNSQFHPYTGSNKKFKQFSPFEIVYRFLFQVNI